MKKRFHLFLIYLLTFSLLLGGCLFLRPPLEPTFSDMTYVRPDVAMLQQASADAIVLSQSPTLETLMDAVYAFYDHYYNFYTQYALSNIHYCKDLTDIYWEGEYNFCTQSMATVDACLENLLYALADCSLKEQLESEEYFGAGFFDAYSGESFWDETFTALMEQEALLESQYYELTSESSKTMFGSEAYYQKYGTKMAELLRELVEVRQSIAQYAGFDNYLAFSYAYTFGRDYVPEQVDSLLQDIQDSLVPLYRKAVSRNMWSSFRTASTEEETFAYVKNVANTMGGEILNAFSVMETRNLYDITFSSKKYDISFEIYLMNYQVPYVFLNPAGTIDDHLTFAHEFGHFCNDYLSFGSVADIDVAEIFSQGMEYLSLCYGGEHFTKAKLADGLAVYVEQAGYAWFEQQLYTAENITTDEIYSLFAEMGKRFGFDAWQWDSRSFVAIPHFFTEPNYVISYVVSNDAAMQLYQLELAQPGAGLTKYKTNLSNTGLALLSFLDSAGLESPFTPGRIAQVADLFRVALGL